MVKVAGLWEFGWNVPLVEHDLWNFVIRDFKVDEWCMSPVSGIAKPVVERHNTRTFIDDNPSLTPIIIDENGDVPLREFSHPEDVLYVFGKVGRSMLSLGYQSVRVETPAQDGLLWSHQILSIVLYDRQVKQWQ